MKALTLSLGIKCLRLTEYLISRNKRPLLLREETRELLEKGPPFFISPEEIKRHLQEIANLWKLSPRPLDVLLSSDLVFLRLASLRIPTSGEPPLTTLIHEEAARLIPLPLEKVTWCAQQLFFKEDDVVTVLYGALKTEFLETFAEALSDIKFKISSVSSTPWSFYPLISKALHSEKIVLIDIGHRVMTLLSFCHREGDPYKGYFYPYHSKSHLAEEKLFSLEQLASIKEILREFLVPLTTRPIHALLTGEASEQLSSFFTEDLLLSPISIIFHSKKYYNLFYYSCLYIKKATSERCYFAKSYSLLKPPFCFLPPSVVHIQQQQHQLTYFFTVSFLLILFLSFLFFCCHHSMQKMISDIPNQTCLLDQRKAHYEQLEQRVKELQEQQHINETLIELQERKHQWSELLQDLQERLPHRYLWITELSPIVTDASITNEAPQEHLKKITALEIKGLYLENPNNAHIVDDFVNRLQESSCFVLSKKNPEQVIVSRSTPDGTAYAYPFALHLSLKKSISLKEPLL